MNVSDTHKDLQARALVELAAAEEAIAQPLQTPTTSAATQILQAELAATAHPTPSISSWADRPKRPTVDAQQPAIAAASEPTKPCVVNVDEMPTPSDRIESMLAMAQVRAAELVQTPSTRTVRVIPTDDTREDVRAELLDLATYELGRIHPEYSAVPVVTKKQKRVLISLALVLAASTAVWTVPTLQFLVVLAMLAYTATLWLRVQLIRKAFGENQTIDISDEQARSFPDHLLPTYSVLIPAYKEPEVIEHLLGSVALLEYPKDKLEVKLLLEEDDYDTINAIEAKLARGEVLPDFIEVVLVPAGLPRTKPKACNYGLKLCSGDLVTIYDAEDIPEPLQLRRAAIALLGSEDHVACMQARLEFHNHRDNLLTKWFTVEYAQWFTQLLPGLVAMGGPIPLGGTSNHFKRDILDSVGAWDPFNVTEDADLGVRLQREGYGVGVVQSVTLEEANCDFVNWIKQRSRWYKGYLLSFLVHLRDPRRTYREVGGMRPFRNFALFVGGTPLLGALSLLMMAVSGLWTLGRFPLIAELFPSWVGSLAMLLAVVGNLVVVVAGLVTLRLTDKERLLGAVLLTPLYGVMMSIAATKAIIQLVTDPFHWEKTAHGLSATVQHVSAPAEANPADANRTGTAS
jgi:glycosyltransferase XagB